jgi:hypothetical protein
MADQRTGGGPLEERLLSFIATCSDNEQEVLFAMVERAADEPEVSGFGAAQDNERYDRMMEMLANVIKKRDGLQMPIMPKI